MTPTQMYHETKVIEDNIASSLQRTADRLAQTEELAYRTGAVLAEQGAGIDRVQRRLENGVAEGLHTGGRQLSQLEVPWWKFWRRGSMFRRHRGLDLQPPKQVDLAAEEEASATASVAPGSRRRRRRITKAASSASSEISTPEQKAESEGSETALDNIQRMILNIKAAAAEQQEEVAVQNAKLLELENGLDAANDDTARLNTQHERQLQKRRRWFFF